MRTAICRVLAAATATLLPIACGSGYAYTPRAGVTAPMARHVAAEYAIPAETHELNVRVASYGIVDVSPYAGPNEHLRALHLRLVARNDGHRTWVLDTREQRIELDGHGQSAPAFASANPGAPPPAVTVPPGVERVADLFFPLPPQLQTASEMPAFDAIWGLDADQEAEIIRTPFERLLVDATNDTSHDYGVDYFWGPPYWDNPRYPAFAFVGAVAVAPRFVGHPVITLQPAPNWGGRH